MSARNSLHPARITIRRKMHCVSSRHRKEPLIPKQTDEMIEVLSVVGDITNVMTIDPERFMEITSPSSVSMDSVASPQGGQRPRKRAKLDHLSAEEKAQHRKMMNRISAQSARDRQKALMQVQEVQIKNLTASHDKLKEENAMLTNKVETQAAEISRLANLVKEYEAKINLLESFNGAVKPTETVKSEPIEEESCDEYSSLEPAVPRTVPLPKGPELLRSSSCLILLLTCLQWILTHPNSSKPLMTSLSRFLAQKQSSQVDLRKQFLQTRALLLQLALTKSLASVKLKEPG